MFEEAYKLLEINYDSTDFDRLSAEIPTLCKKYKGSGLWQNLVLAVLEHLEAKAKYERKMENE